MKRKDRFFVVDEDWEYFYIWDRVKRKIVLAATPTGCYKDVEIALTVCRGLEKRERASAFESSPSIS